MLSCNINVYITKVVLYYHISQIFSAFAFVAMVSYDFSSMLVIDHNGRYRTPESSTVVATERTFLPTRF